MNNRIRLMKGQTGARKYLLSSLLLLFLGGSLAAQTPGDSLAGKVDALFASVDNASSPGAAVLVVRNGRVLLQRCYGMANLEHRVPIDPSTVFDVASLSKQFTGMAISMLVEENKISLQDDIRKYIPELPRFDHPITIGHLIHHTSGLRDWPGTLALAGWRMDDVITFDQILDMAYHQQDLNFVPGSEYSYSNTGYNLLAELIQRVSGKSFREWTREHIFEPLGMNDTHFHDEYSEIVPGKAYGYAREGDGKYRAVSNGLTALGSSSLYTNINDLARWVINFETHKVGGKAVWERMLRRGVLNSGEQISYAFGLNVGGHRGLKTISHSGGWAAFSTFLLHFPGQAFSVVVLMNHSPANPAGTAYAIADIYLAAETERSREKEEAKERRPAQKRGTSEPVNLSVSLLDEYTGTYRLGPAWYVTIERQGDRLTAYATEETTVPMAARSDSVFWVEAYGAPITFVRGNNGKASAFRYRGMTCPRVEPVPKADATALRDLTGIYKSEELGTSYRLVLKDGELQALHPRHGAIELIPAWKDEFRGVVWFMHTVKFVRDENGNVTGFLVSQQRSRNQRFIKQGFPE